MLKQHSFCQLQNDTGLGQRLGKDGNLDAANVEQRNHRGHRKSGRLALLAPRQHGANAHVVAGPAHLAPNTHAICVPGGAKDARCHQLDDKPDQLQLEIGRARHQSVDVFADLSDRVEAVERFL